MKTILEKIDERKLEMNKFVSALQTKDARTENGMPTHSTSGNTLLDMFFKMGGARKVSETELQLMLSSALGYDKLLTTKAVFYNRDCRGGQGERRTFRVFITYLAKNYPELLIKNLELIPEYGRWDDVLVLLDTPVKDNALSLIAYALRNGDGLCAKWMPRENKHNGRYAKMIMSYMSLTPRQYRKQLASATKVVETQMCAKKWGNITYSQVPSVASNKYRKCFLRNDGERYRKFIEKVLKGEEKINASVIYPSDIVKKITEQYYGKLPAAEERAIQAQWNSLPDFMPKELNILPVCDVSGSMTGEPLNVSLALGIYLSERNPGPFENAWITFSSRPTLQHLTATTLVEKVRQMNLRDGNSNTNLEAVFSLILKKATESNLSEEDMPKFILLISDMQFDSAVASPNSTALEMIKRNYSLAGYQVPNIIFWNVRASSGVPVKITDQGVALVSGYSPSIMKQVCSGELSPMGLMLKTLNSERYSKVTI